MGLPTQCSSTTNKHSEMNQFFDIGSLRKKPWKEGRNHLGGGSRLPHFSKRWFMRFVQKCNKVSLSGGVTYIWHFCHVIKRSIEYCRQIFTINLAKRAFPAFSESLKGVVTQKLDPRPPLFKCWLRRWVYDFLSICLFTYNIKCATMFHEG